MNGGDEEKTTDENDPGDEEKTTDENDPEDEEESEVAISGEYLPASGSQPSGTWGGALKEAMQNKAVAHAYKMYEARVRSALDATLTVAEFANAKIYLYTQLDKLERIDEFIDEEREVQHTQRETRLKEENAKLHKAETKYYKTLHEKLNAQAKVDGFKTSQTSSSPDDSLSNEDEEFLQTAKKDSRFTVLKQKILVASEELKSELREKGELTEVLEKTIDEDRTEKTKLVREHVFGGE